MNTAMSVIDLIENLKKRGIPENEYHTYVNYYFQSKTRRLRIPYIGTFELTPYCNLDCKMCYVHLSNTQFTQANLLSIDIWKSIMLEAHEAGMRKANFTGGECLTYSGFIELYLFLLDMGVKSGVLTNGILLGKEYIDFFNCYRPRVIQISLYGASNDDYEAVTGQRVFDTVYENIKNLKEANLPVVVTITPNQYMTGDFRHLLEVVDDLNVPYNINSRLLPPRKATGRSRIDFSDDQYIRLYRVKNELSHYDCTEVDYEYLPEENKTDNNQYRYGLKCNAGKNSFVILHNGEMCPCVGLDEVRTKPLENGFVDSWKQLVNLADNYLIPEECDGCVYHDECLTCPALHKDAPRGHCDKRICERTKRLVCAGILPVPQRKEDSV